MRMLGIGGIILSVFIGLFIGPLLVYAAVGDYWHTLFSLNTVSFARPLAGIAGVLLTAAMIFWANRYRRASAVGAIAGFSAAVGEWIVAMLPWVGFYYNHSACAASQYCPILSANELRAGAITVGIYFAILFTLAGFCLTLFTSAVIRRFN